MQVILLLIPLVLGTAWGRVARFDNYTVYRLTPKTDEQVLKLRQLETSGLNFDFWQSPSFKNAPVDLMVPPHRHAQFAELIQALQIDTKQIIDNVQRLIDDSTPASKSGEFGWTSYHRLDENRLWRMTRKPYGDCIGVDPNRNWGFHWNEGGTSGPCEEIYPGPEPFSEVETRSLSEYITSIHENLVGYLAIHSYSQLLLIPYGYSNAHVENYAELTLAGRCKMKFSAVVLITALAVASANIVRYDNYKVYRMLPTTEEQLSRLRELERTSIEYNFWKSPVARNVPVDVMVPPNMEEHFQGLVHRLQIRAIPYITDVQTLIDEGNVKTKSGRFGWNEYYNVDEVKGGADQNPCSETYAGPEPFSEIETRTLSQYIGTIQHELVGYLAFHSYSQLLLIPYGHTYEHLDNYEELMAIGNKASTSLSQRYGTEYIVGAIPDVISAVVSAHVARYDNYKVYRMFPNTESQLKALRQLEDTTVDFDFWRGPSAKNASVEIMVAPHKEPHFHELMDELKLVATPYIPNVQSLIDETNRKNMKTNRFGWNAYYDCAE
ncbi:uncharacterized protein CBL_21339, partial [Carabus blaptoides fortunei]